MWGLAPSDELALCSLASLFADPFADASEESHDNTKVHIRVQQRNGRKCITTVAGLADDLDVKRILKAFKKNFSCNGAIAKDTELGQVRASTRS